MTAAYLFGGIVGQRNLTDAQMGNGQSGQGTVAVEKAFPFHRYAKRYWCKAGGVRRQAAPLSPLPWANSWAGSSA